MTGTRLRYLLSLIVLLSLSVSLYSGYRSRGASFGSLSLNFYDSHTHIDLNNLKSSQFADEEGQRVLILTPLRDAAPYLPNYFSLLGNLSYPHHLIDLAFLISDTTDETLASIERFSDRLQRTRRTALRDIRIIRKDFGMDSFSQDVESRHEFMYQGERRKMLGRARNYLLSAGLRHDHAWVLWLDVDIEEYPNSLISDLASHDSDVIVPSIWFHRIEEDKDIEGRFDYNSWQETEAGLKLAASLPMDIVLAEGYEEFNTSRLHLCLMGEKDGDLTVTVPLDGIGGVVILVKADVHRSGINFPAYAFEHQAETEGFGKMARRAGYRVLGLMNYIVWHVDTAERPGRDGKLQTEKVTES